MSTITIAKNQITMVVTNKERRTKAVHEPRKINLCAENISMQGNNLND